MNTPQPSWMTRATERTRAGRLGEAPAQEGQFLDGRHNGSAGSRAYKMFFPPAAAMRPLPLVFMLQGCTRDPDDFARGTRMNTLALAEGLLVLHREQARKANTSGGWDWFKHDHRVPR